MKLAQRNIERHYIVVGRTEEMRETIAALECTMPKFFKGSLRKYDLLGKRMLYLQTKIKQLHMK